jgi:hypothetical protein
MDREHQADWGARHKQSINTDVILPVENMAEHLISPRSKFPDTLVPTEHNIQCENAATNYSRPNPPKPHLLHPSMWLYEVASLLSAIYILGGTIIVLAIYDNKPSPIIEGRSIYHPSRSKVKVLGSHAKIEGFYDRAGAFAEKRSAFKDLGWRSKPIIWQIRQQGLVSRLDAIFWHTVALSEVSEEGSEIVFFSLIKALNRYT